MLGGGSRVWGEGVCDEGERLDGKSDSSWYRLRLGVLGLRRWMRIDAVSRVVGAVALVHERD